MNSKVKWVQRVGAGYGVEIHIINITIYIYFFFFTYTLFFPVITIITTTIIIRTTGVL